jgi:hypothetical protein
VATALSPFTRVVIDLLADAAADTAAPSALRVGFRAEVQSMYPAIRHGETIVVSPVREDAIAEGDVLLCRQGHRLLAHRFVAWRAVGDGRLLELRGDAKSASDALVAATAVIGRVESVQRDGQTLRLCGPGPRWQHRVRAAAFRTRAYFARRFGRASTNARMRRVAGSHEA